MGQNNIGKGKITVGKKRGNSNIGKRENNRGGKRVGHSNIDKGKITEGEIEWDIAT